MKIYSFADNSHLAAIQQINCEGIAHPWNLEHIAQAIVQQQVFICRQQQHILAFSIWQMVADEAELHLLATNKDFLRQGNAENLILAFIKQQDIIKRIFLEVRISNQIALALYHKLGFSQIALRKDYYQNPVEDAVIMEKIIC